MYRQFTYYDHWKLRVRVGICRFDNVDGETCIHER